MEKVNIDMRRYASDFLFQLVDAFSSMELKLTKKAYQASFRHMTLGSSPGIH